VAGAAVAGAAVAGAGVTLPQLTLALSSQTRRLGLKAVPAGQAMWVVLPKVHSMKWRQLYGSTWMPVARL